MKVKFIFMYKCEESGSERESAIASARIVESDRSSESDCNWECKCKCEVKVRK
jgi:hypothetical protein